MSNGRRTSKVSMPTGDGKGTMQDVTPTAVHQGKTFEGQEERLMEHSEEAAWMRIGKAAHAFNNFHKAYATDHGLTQDELIAAAYLENLNLREWYPPELGGAQHYDEQCKKVWEWFEENKSKP